MEDKTFDCDKRLYCLVCKLSKVFDFGSLFNQYPNWNLLKGKLYVLRHRIDSSRTRHLLGIYNTPFWAESVLKQVVIKTVNAIACVYLLALELKIGQIAWERFGQALASPSLWLRMLGCGGGGVFCQHCRGERVNKFITLTVSLLLGNVHSIPDSLLTVNIYRLCTAIRGISNIVGPWTETFSAVMSLST